MWVGLLGFASLLVVGWAFESCEVASCKFASQSFVRWKGGALWFVSLWTVGCNVVGQWAAEKFVGFQFVGCNSLSWVLSLWAASSQVVGCGWQVFGFCGCELLGCGL